MSLSPMRGCVLLDFAFVSCILRDMELRVKGHDEPIAETIRQAREAANLSQVELAARLGVHPRTVQYWEAGKVPQPKHRRAIGEFLDEREETAA